MNLADASSTALERLHRQGHLLHSQLLKIVGGDESLLREVRDRLIADGLVIDKLGGVLVMPEDRRLNNQLPQDNDHGEPGAVRPRIPGQEIRGLTAPGSPNPEGDVCVAAGVPTTWTVAEHGSQQTVAATTCAPSSEVRITEVSPAVQGRVAAKQPVSASPLRYYLWNAGRESGPFPREELEQRLAEGRLQPTDFVRIDSDDEWIAASEALSRTGSSQNSRPRRTVTSPKADELAAEVSRAMTATRREMKALTNPELKTVSRAAPQWGALPSDAAWNWLASQGGKGRLQNLALIVLLGLVVWAYRAWPTSASSIKTELMDYHNELRVLHVRNQNTSSPEWRQYVAKHRPRILELVKTLKSQAQGTRPERQLLYAAERGLLSMLDEGLDGPAEKKFMASMGLASQILKGESPDNLSAPASHSGPPGSAATNSGPLSSTTSNPAVPPGASATTPTVSPHAPSPHSAIPPGAARPTR